MLAQLRSLPDSFFLDNEFVVLTYETFSAKPEYASARASVEELLQEKLLKSRGQPPTPTDDDALNARRWVVEGTSERSLQPSIMNERRGPSTFEALSRIQIQEHEVTNKMLQL
jgi:hypothetical protein